MAQEQNRKSERLPFAAPLRVLKPTAQEAQGVDIAPGGIGIDVPQAIAAGSPVELALSDGGPAIVGTVRVARPAPSGGCRLGIAFQKEDAGIAARAQAILARK